MAPFLAPFNQTHRVPDSTFQAYSTPSNLVRYSSNDVSLIPEDTAVEMSGSVVSFRPGELRKVDDAVFSLYVALSDAFDAPIVGDSVPPSWCSLWEMLVANNTEEAKSKRIYLLESISAGDSRLHLSKISFSPFDVRKISGLLGAGCLQPLRDFDRVQHSRFDGDV